MQCSPDDIRVRRGDARQIDILVDEVDGSPATPDGAQIRWSYGLTPSRLTAVKTEADTASVSLVDVTVNGALRKAVRRTLSQAETIALKAYETYYFQCRLTFAGMPETVEVGTFLVEPQQDAA